MTSAITTRRRTVAVLDDYQNLSSHYISHLTSTLDIAVYRDTILPSVDLQGLLNRLNQYEVLVTMRERTPITKEVLDGLPNLKIILTTGMRNRGIDIEYAKSKGVQVVGTPNGDAPKETPPRYTPTVQHTWALILSLLGNIPRDHNIVTQSSSWLNALPLNTYTPGLTLGLLGLGNLGIGVARIAKMAFGFKVIAWSPHLTQERADQSAQDVELQTGDVQVVDKETLFRESDVISIHLILADSTRSIVSTGELESMKPSAFLVNTSRGPLVEEKALLGCLGKGRIRGYAGDVFDIEPLPVDSAWRTTQWGTEGRSEVVLTPHSGYSFDTQLGNMWEKTKENLERLSRDEDLLWPLQ